MLKKWVGSSALHTTSSETPQRRLGNWIDGYLEFTENTEPPKSYHTWTALGCIASVLQRKCYIDWHPDRIYPNLYIVLVGPSAQTRKSTALKIGERMVAGLGIPTIGQDNSPEAVIKNIAQSNDTYFIDKGPRNQCAVTCFTEELAVFLGRQNNEFQAYLTNWYDSPDVWKRTTKHQGIDEISGLCFNLIGAMAPDWIPHVFSPESIGGGFTSRIVFVNETKKYKTIADPNLYPPSKQLQEDLMVDLEQIQRITGPFTFSKDARQFCVEWYEEDDAAIQAGQYPIADTAFYSYCGRRGTLLRKLSMCVCAARTNDPVISIDDVKRALKILRSAEGNMPGIFDAVGRSDNASAMHAFRAMLQGYGKIKRSTALRDMSKDITMEQLEAIEHMLAAQHHLKRTVLPMENDILYEWLP